MSAYDSDDASEPESNAPNTQPVTAPDDGDDAPEEVSTVILRGPPTIPEIPVKAVANNKNRRLTVRGREEPRKIARYPMKPRKPSLLQQLYKEEIAKEKIFIRSCVSYVVNKAFFYDEQENMETIRTTPLLGKLLSNEIIKERNLILQCIRHVCNKNLYSVPYSSVSTSYL